MLVLSREINEEICINITKDMIEQLGDTEIILTITEIRGNKVKLGITAPKLIPVHRREVYDKLKDGNGKRN